VGVLDLLLRLLAPFTPFICEELWQTLGRLARERGLPAPKHAEEACAIGTWPEPPASWRDEALEGRFARLRDIIAAVRNVRATYRIDDRTQLELHLRCAPEVASHLARVAGYLGSLAHTVLASVGPATSRPSSSASFASADVDGFIPLEGVVDRKAELARQQKEGEKVRGSIARHEGKLANAGFVNQAPPEVVEQVRETLAGLRKQEASIQEAVVALGG
jgi:valyl-tRNA synthetase